MSNFAPIIPPKDAEHWVYEAFRSITAQFSQTALAISAMQRGETPDGSGQPIVDLTKYFYKPGLPGGQLAYGGFGPSEDLTLGSNPTTTKGNINFGSQATYDEANVLWGIGTTSPAARLHLAHTTGGGTTQVLPLLGGAQGGSFGIVDGIGGTNAALALQTNDGDTSHIESGAGPIQFYVQMNPVSSPPASCTVFVWAKGVAPDTAWDMWFYDTVPPFGGGPGAGFVKFALPVPSGLAGGVYTLLSYTLSPAEIATITGGVNGWTNVHIGFRSFGITWATQLYLEVPGTFNSTPLQRWEMPGNVRLDLNWAQDGASASVLKMSGSYKFQFGNTGLEFAIGSPAANKIWTATDTDGTGAWASVNLLSAYHADTVAQTVSRGSLIYGNSTPKWDELVIGASGTILYSNGTDAAWATLATAGIASNAEKYVVIGPATAGLTSERILTGTANQITVTDGGANSAVTLSTPQNLDTAAAFQVGTLGVGVAPSIGLVHILGTGATAPLVLSTSIATAGPYIVFRDTDTGNTKLLVANSITGTTSLALPDGGGMSGSDFLVSRTSLDTLTQKTLATDAIFKTSTSSSGASFSDSGTATKRLRIILSGAVGNSFFDIQNTSARGYTFPNYTGIVAVPPDEGTSGNILTSTGAGSQPTYQTLASAGVAPKDALYITLSTNATLTNERVLTGTSNQITVTDNGAGSTVVLSTPQNLHTSAVFQVSTLGLGAVARTSPATLALDVTGRTAFVTVVQSFSVDQSNYDIGNSTVLRLTSTAVNKTLRGFTNGVDGRIVFITNDGSNAFNIDHQNASATAANRIITSSGSLIVLKSGQMCVAVYDGTASRWRITDWMQPTGTYQITGSFEWDATLTINRDSSGALLIEGNLPGTPPQISLQDSGTTNTILLRAPSISGNWSVDLPDYTGTLVLVGNDPPPVAAGSLGKVDLAAQTANIATTNLSNAPTAGDYIVEVYLQCTTANAGSGTLTVTIGWTDNVGATTSTPITLFSLAATGRTTGRQFVRVASGEITYAVAITGSYLTAQYAVSARVIALG